MAHYSRERQIDSHPDLLYEFLAEVSNLPKYFTRMTEARLVGPEEVHTKAVLDMPGAPGEVEGTAWFRRDATNRSIEWGSEGENDYHGRLRVDAAYPTGSLVILDLYTEAAHGGVDEGIDETLEALAHVSPS